MTHTKTPVGLDALTALEQAATPGPWALDHSPKVFGQVHDAPNWPAGDTILLGRAEVAADAALIAAARNALPDLIAAARELDNLRAEVRGLAVEARRRKTAYPSHPHWAAWDLCEADLRAALTKEADRG